LATLAASAVNALSARLEHIQRRLVPVTQPAPPAASAAASGGAPDPTDPRVETIEKFLTSPGPVLVAGPGAATWVEALMAAGHDPSGVDPTTDEFAAAAGGRVRAGDVLDHLRSVEAGRLAGVVLIGAMAPAETAHLAALGTELARVTERVAVSSAAPWAWRLRVGEPAADVADRRPLSPETWLAALDGAGFTATGTYGAGGADYVVTGIRAGTDVD
jgi:hypothetical protein